MVSTAIRTFGLTALILAATGCAKGPVTTQEIVQNEEFITVDSTKVPEEWVERSVWKRQIGKTHTIRVKPGHRVKVILVPDETAQDSAGAAAP
jgi:hypothetical protein